MKSTSENIQSHLTSIEEKSAKLQHLIRSSVSPSNPEKKVSSHFFSIAKEVIHNNYNEFYFLEC